MRTTGSTGYTPPGAGSVPPAAHAASHADGGSDPITPESIGATPDQAFTGLTGGSATALDGIATVLLPVDTTLRHTCVAGDLGVWQLGAGTDAENGTTVIRPDDYNASTNAKVWRRRL